MISPQAEVYTLLQSNNIQPTTLSPRSPRSPLHFHSACDVVFPEVRKCFEEWQGLLQEDLDSKELKKGGKKLWKSPEAFKHVLFHDSSLTLEFQDWLTEFHPHALHVFFLYDYLRRMLKEYPTYLRASSLVYLEKCRKVYETLIMPHMDKLQLDTQTVVDIQTRLNKATKEYNNSNSTNNDDSKTADDTAQQNIIISPYIYSTLKLDVSVKLAQLFSAFQLQL